jgi:hypothetical protein
MSSVGPGSLAADTGRRSARLQAGSNPYYASPRRARSRSRAPSDGSDADSAADDPGRPAGVQVVTPATAPPPAPRSAAAASGSRSSPPSLVERELELNRRQLAASRQQLADQERLLADQRAIVAHQRQLAEQQQAMAAVHAENARLHAQLALAGASVSVPAAAPVSDVDAERLKLGLSSLDSLSATPEWRDRFAVRTDIAVSHIAAVVAALFHGLGSVPLASEYRAFLHGVLSMPAEGEDVPVDDYMQSGAGAQMAATFGITARPSSPNDDRSSDSGSGSQSSAGALSQRRAADVTAITAVLLDGNSHGPDVVRLRILDSLLHATLKRLTAAGPDTPEYEAVNLHPTFAAAVSALLTCADHAERSINERTVARAFGPCPLYNRGGAPIANLSLAQCARMVVKDAAARLQCLQRLNYARLAIQLAVAAAPAGTDNRGHFMRAVRKAALRTVSATADDLAGLSSALEDVAAKYTNMPSTGIFKLANSADLSRILFLPVTVAPASITASKALPPGPARGRRRLPSSLAPSSPAPVPASRARRRRAGSSAPWVRSARTWCWRGIPLRCPGPARPGRL